MHINQIVKQPVPPQTDALWVDTSGNNVTIKVYNGGWKESLGSSSDIDTSEIEAEIAGKQDKLEATGSATLPVYIDEEGNVQSTTGISYSCTTTEDDEDNSGKTITDDVTVSIGSNITLTDNQTYWDEDAEDYANTIMGWIIDAGSIKSLSNKVEIDRLGTIQGRIFHAKSFFAENIALSDISICKDTSNTDNLIVILDDQEACINGVRLSTLSKSLESNAEEVADLQTSVADLQTSVASIQAKLPMAVSATCNDTIDSLTLVIDDEDTTANKLRNIATAFLSGRYVYLSVTSTGTKGTIGNDVNGSEVSKLILPVLGVQDDGLGSYILTLLLPTGYGLDKEMPSIGKYAVDGLEIRPIQEAES